MFGNENLKNGASEGIKTWDQSGYHLPRKAINPHNEEPPKRRNGEMLAFDTDGKEFICIVGDLGSIPGLGRYPGGGNGKSLQYSCLENSHERGAWQATAHGVAKSPTRLSD